MKNNKGFSMVEGIILIVVFVMLILLVVSSISTTRAISPLEGNIQKGYAIPGKLKPALTDLDNNKEYEFVLEYDSIKYLVVLDDKGKPQLKEFKVKSSEIFLE